MLAFDAQNSVVGSLLGELGIGKKDVTSDLVGKAPQLGIDTDIQKRLDALTIPMTCHLHHHHHHLTTSSHHYQNHHDNCYHHRQLILIQFNYHHQLYHLIFHHHHKYFPKQQRQNKNKA